MISPGGIPQIAGDMDALAAHAASLSTVGGSFSATGERVNSTWQQLAGVYEAPEVGQLLAATAPVQTTAASVGEDISAVGAALGTYAATVREIKAALESLRSQAEGFVAENPGDNWESDDGKVDRNNELVGAVNAQVAAFHEAQRSCANTINALYGGVQYRADNGDGQASAGKFGYTADQLNGAAGEDGALPWGSTQERDRGLLGDIASFGGGLWEGAKMFAGDLGSLIGRDPTTGGWSWGTAGTAWAGVAKFGAALVVVGARPGGLAATPSPAIPGIFEEGEASALLTEAGKSIIAYDEWGQGDNARAGGIATFNVLSAVVGTKGAGGALRGGGAAIQASRVGAVSRAGAAMIRGGEFLGRLPTTESLAARVSQHVPSLRLPDFGGLPDVNVPHHVDAPRVDTPGVDTPRVEERPAAVHPGSVGDNLGNRTPDVNTSSTPSTPDTDVPGPRGDTPPPAAAVPDAAPQHADPAGNGAAPDGPAHHNDVPAHDSEPALVGAGNDTAPGRGDGPADYTPGDSAPGDTTPGGTTPGDTAPGPVAGGADADAARPDYDGAPDFRASDADRQAFRDTYSGYAEDATFVENLQASDPTYRDIPTEDLTAIRGYTGDEFYRAMNEGLREGDPALLARYDSHIRAVTSGLNQLPHYEGAVGRGITVSDPTALRDLVGRYEPGEVVREPSFVSTDTRSSFPGNVQFDIRSRTGRDVSLLSRYASTETEVLFPPGSSFRVLERTFDPATGTWYIRMVEGG